MKELKPTTVGFLSIYNLYFATIFAISLGAWTEFGK
jgi:hypothetical protein